VNDIDGGKAEDLEHVVPMCRQMACGTRTPLETGTAAGLVLRKETTGLLPRGAADLSGSGIGCAGAHTRFGDSDSDGGSSSDTDQATTGAAPCASEGAPGGGDDTPCTEDEGSLAAVDESAAVQAGEEVSSTMQMKKYWYQRFSLFSRFKEGQ